MKSKADTFLSQINADLRASGKSGKSASLPKHLLTLQELVGEAKEPTDEQQAADRILGGTIASFLATKKRITECELSE